MVQCEAPRGKGIQGQRETERKGVGGRKIYRDIERMRERERGDEQIEREREVER